MANLLVGLQQNLVLLALQHKKICRYEGIELMLTQGYRTAAEQMVLYQKGRAKTPKGWVVVDKNQVVTRALPEQSPHCRRAAYDVAILVNGKIKWTGIDDKYERSGVLGEELGLVWGGRFSAPDIDHYELPNWRTLPYTEGAS